jgi:nucleoporin NDC1
MWEIHLTLAKPFYDLSRSTAEPTRVPDLISILWNAGVIGMLLGCTWQVSSLLFITYIGQEPVKKDLPLSAASKDPNGTLLSGLKAKRDVVKTFAFWEMAIIAQNHPDRRKAIFTDIDRPSGPIWTEMLEAALKVLQQADERLIPPTPEAAPSDEVQTIDSLPHIIPETRGGDVIAPATPSRRNLVAKLAVAGAKRLGTTPEPWRPKLDEAVKLIESSKAAGKAAAAEIKQSPVAWLFTSSTASTVNATVLGSPYGNAAILVDAIELVTRMLVSSLQEDLYGNAMRGVPAAVRQFTTTITLIETFMDDKALRDGTVFEVDIILARLKAGLAELLAAFQNFLSETALGIAELNAAKKASMPKKISLQDVAKEPARKERAHADRSRRDQQPERQQNSTSTRLFVRQEPQRNPSSEMNGRTIKVGKRREMEQVR